MPKEASEQEQQVTIEQIIEALRNEPMSAAAKGALNAILDDYLNLLNNTERTNK